MAKAAIDLKTNAVRILDQAGTVYELRRYDVDEADLRAETAQLWDIVGISAGMRGLQILLAPVGLIRITGGILANLTRSTASAQHPASSAR